MDTCFLQAVAILTIFLAGGTVFYGVVRQPERFFRAERVAYCFPIGMTVLAVAFFLMSLAGIGLNAVVVVCGVVVSAMLVRKIRGVPLKEFWLRPATAATESKRLDEFEWMLILVIIACLGARAIACYITPLTDWDALNNWGIRAKLLYLGNVRSYDDYFRQAQFRYLNQTYPLLWPFMYAWMCTVLGRWDDISMMAINPFNLIVFALLVFYTARKFTSRKVALALMAMVASLPAPLHYTECGQGDIPLTMMSGASLFCLFAWMRERHLDSLVLSGILMGGALFTKTEGQLVFGAHLCTAVLSVFAPGTSHDRRKWFGQVVLYVVLALVLYAPWLLYRSTLPYEAWQVGGRPMGGVMRWSLIPTFLASITGNALHFYNQYNLPKWNLLWIVLPMFIFLSKSSKQYPWVLLLGMFALQAAGVAFVELISQERVTLHEMEAAYERYTIIMLPPLWLVLGKCMDEWWSFWQASTPASTIDVQPRGIVHKRA